ncbi:hypothetical protein [Phaeacidiphilus oryzae]|uniref:hypothetical protein n=1 Tax=Phaeacidiphilus oryzae TaxID=348818 RepID=UPI00055DD378|nr:hypothetical protein [Phaeacidiphilus oryzae]
MTANPLFVIAGAIAALGLFLGARLAARHAAARAGARRAYAAAQVREAAGTRRIYRRPRGGRL